MIHNDIVQKLWNFCEVLRDDDINYSDYVTELVLLLFSENGGKVNDRTAVLHGDVGAARRAKHVDVPSESPAERT